MGELVYDDFKERYKIANNLLDTTTVVTEEDVQKAFAILMVYNAWTEEVMQEQRAQFIKELKEDRKLYIESQQRQVRNTHGEGVEATALDLWNELKAKQDQERGSKVEEPPAVNKNNI